MRRMTLTAGAEEKRYEKRNICRVVGKIRRWRTRKYKIKTD
jgi:hypothetical protein